MRRGFKTVELGFGLCAPSYAFKGVDGDGGQTATPTPQANAEELLARRLQGIEQGVGNLGVQQQIMNHPLLREALAAAQSGRKVKIVEDVQTTEVPQPDKPLDEMNNIEFAKYLQGSLGAQLDNTLGSKLDKVLQEKLNPILEQLGGVQQFVAKTAEQKMAEDIRVTSAKYTDFAKFGPQMVELNKQYPTLNAKQLYMLAKTDSGESFAEPTSAPNVDSERPGSSVTRPSLREVRKGELPKGQKGFSQLLRESLTRQDHSNLPTY